MPPAPDPEAPSGGTYVIDLFPEERRELTVRFEMPATDRLMFRRQPGQVPPEIIVHYDGCDPVRGGYLTRDLYIELDGECPEFPEIDFEDPELLFLSMAPDGTRVHG